MHSVRPAQFASSWRVEDESPAIQICPVPRMTSPVFPSLEDDPDLGLTPEKPLSLHKSKQHKETRSKARQKVRFADNIDPQEKVYTTFENNIMNSKKKVANGANDSIEIINIETGNISLNDSQLTEDQPRTIRYEANEPVNKYTKMIESGESLSSCLFATFGDGSHKKDVDLTLTDSDTQNSVIPPVEHALARPEFNSTLWMNKELQQLKSQTLNVAAAVEEKLKASLSTRQKIAEKTYRQVNHLPLEQQFPELVSLEVAEEEVVSIANRELSAKVKPSKKDRTKAQSASNRSLPDILDFLTPDLQKEGASFSLEGLFPPQDAFVVAPPESAFDIYKHIRVWENY